jgi:hypothetical protein
LNRQVIKKGRYAGFGMGFGQFVILAGTGLAYYVGGQLVLQGRTTFPKILAVVLVMMLGAIGLGQASVDATNQNEALQVAGGWWWLVAGGGW